MEKFLKIKNVTSRRKKIYNCEDYFSSSLKNIRPYEFKIQKLYLFATVNMNFGTYNFSSQRIKCLYYK